MKILIKKETITEIATWISKNIETRPSIPILEGLVIQTQGSDSISLYMFDYKESGYIQAEAKVEKEGKIVVPGRKFADICRRLPDSQVEIEEKNSSVNIKANKTKFALTKYVESEYPKFPEFPRSIGKVENKLFKKAIEQVVVSVDKSGVTPVLNCISISIEGDKLTLIGTDRYRISRKILKWEPKDGENLSIKNILVPGRSLDEISKSFEDEKFVELAISTGESDNGENVGEVGGSGGDGETGNETEKSEISGFDVKTFGILSNYKKKSVQTVNNDFPDTSLLFKGDYETVVKIEREQLLETLKRVNIIAEEHKKMYCFFDDKTNVLNVSSGNEENTYASEEIHCKINGNSQTLVFDPRYLIDGATECEGKILTVNIKNPSKPVLISGEDKVDTEFKYILVPTIVN